MKFFLFYKTKKPIFTIFTDMQEHHKKSILITNDDGIRSTYIYALAEAISEIANVYVFAPEKEQSGVSHRFSATEGLNVSYQKELSKNFMEFYSVSGSPSDCVKFAISHFSKYGLSTEKLESSINFDLCISGINIGENSGVSALYSGTVAGAREACLWGIPSIALSLRGKAKILDVAIDFAKNAVKNLWYQSIPKNVFWNVNFPNVERNLFKGFKEAKMALGMFTDNYTKKDELWYLDGEKLWNLEPKDSDDYLLNEGYATITPHTIDQTHFESLKKINSIMDTL